MESLKSMKERLNYLQIEFAISKLRAKEALVVVQHFNKQMDTVVNEIRNLSQKMDEHPEHNQYRPLLSLEHEALRDILGSVLDGLESYVKEK